MSMLAFKRLLTGGLVAMSMAFTGCLTDDNGGGGGGGTDSTTIKMETVGAQNAAPGSFLDADNFTVYTVTTAPAAAAQIDLVFAYSTSQAASAIYSPKAAADGIGGSAGFDYVKTALGTNARVTEIRTIASATFDGITTQATLDAAWTGGQAVSDGRLAVTTGTTFACKTNGNKTVAIKVTALNNPGQSGTASLTGKAKF